MVPQTTISLHQLSRIVRQGSFLGAVTASPRNVDKVKRAERRTAPGLSRDRIPGGGRRRGVQTGAAPVFREKRREVLYGRACGSAGKLFRKSAGAHRPRPGRPKGQEGAKLDS